MARDSASIVFGENKLVSVRTENQNKQQIYIVHMHGEKAGCLVSCINKRPSPSG